METSEVKIKLNDEGFGKFFIEKDQNEVAKMEVSVSENYLTVYHTEVSPIALGSGLAKEMFTFMVAYARTNHVKVIPLCVFVHKQFVKNPSLYNDIWEQNR